MNQDPASSQKLLEQTRFELERTKSMLEQLLRRRERGSTKPKRPLLPADGDRAQATYRIEGTPEQLATFDFFLRHVSTACEAGSTAFYQLMVDGDGAASLTIERDGERIGITGEEEDWLFGEGERPQEMLEVTYRDEEVLEIEIV